jgi:hypothetical protein
MGREEKREKVVCSDYSGFTGNGPAEQAMGAEGAGA